MKQIQTENSNINPLDTLQLWSISIVMVIALFGLAGYIPGLRILGSMSENYYPMAPSTATSFLIFASLLIIVRNKSIISLLISRITAVIITSLLTIFGLLIFIEYFVESEIALESLIIPLTENIRGIPVGFMSYSTGGLFVVTGISVLLFVLNKNSNKQLLGHLSGVLGSFIVFCAMTFILAYLLGQPLLYHGDSTVPMALTTAMAFFFLGLAVLFGVGTNHLPLLLFKGDSTSAKLLRTFVPLVILIVLILNILNYSVFYGDVQINTALLVAILIMLSMIVAAIAIFYISKRTGKEIDKAMQQVRTSQILLESSIESVKDMIAFSIDINYKYLYFNSTHKMTMKSLYNADVEVGRNVLDCICVESDIDQAKECFERSLAGERFSEIAVYGESSNRQYFETFYTPIYNDKNEIMGTTAFAREITHRIKTEKAITSLNEKLEQKVEERTKELKGKVSQLESFHDATVDREIRMKELRDEIEELKKKTKNYYKKMSNGAK